MLRFVVDLVRHERVKRQMPPGPRGLPLLGNLLQMTRLPFIQYMQWAEQYGRYRFALVSDILKQGNCWSRSYILAAYWHGAYRRLERLHDYRRSDRSVKRTLLSIAMLILSMKIVAQAYTVIDRGSSWHDLCLTGWRFL